MSTPKHSSEDVSQDSREVLVPNNLSFLEDILWEWVAIQERSIRMWKGKDALWWYNERVSVGGFAGAIWRSGGIVLEEYSTDKLDADGAASKTAKSVVGRGDMDFVLGGRQFTMEAKQCWSRVRIKRVKDALAQAERDVARCRRSNKYIRLAVVFAPLSLMGRSIESDIADWTRQARDLKDCARAWVFPGSGRNLDYRWGDNHRFYPGVGVFVKRISA